MINKCELVYIYHSILSPQFNPTIRLRNFAMFKKTENTS